MTIGESLQYGIKIIGQRDTILLLSHITGRPSAYILLHQNEYLPNANLFMEYVTRRKQGEPLQYIIQQWDFMGQTFRTDSRALIPRPETELLVEEAMAFLSQWEQSLPLSILDLCTGSGCIAISLASSGNYNITAADISPEALTLAKENAKKNEKKISFIESNLFSNITGTFDLIISNPPYITTAEMDGLSETVLNYEPHIALHGGTDGMDIYRQLIPQSLNYLNTGGALFLEIGPPEVKDIMQETGFKNIQLKNDYAGHPRILSGICQTVMYMPGSVIPGLTRNLANFIF